MLSFLSKLVCSFYIIYLITIYISCNNDLNKIRNSHISDMLQIYDDEIEGPVRNLEQKQQNINDNSDFQQNDREKRFWSFKHKGSYNKESENKNKLHMRETKAKENLPKSNFDAEVLNKPLKDDDSENEYEDALVEYTPDGKYKIIPIRALRLTRATPSDNAPDEYGEQVCPERTTDPCVDIDPKNINHTANALHVLQKHMKERKLERCNCKSRQDKVCGIHGNWFSKVAGMLIHIRVNTSGRINVKFMNTLPPTSGSLNSEWSARGIAPFAKGGLFTITAWHLGKKQVAVFVGQCRLCNYVEHILGWWVFSKQARNCREFLISGEVYTDIMQKENEHELKDFKWETRNTHSTRRCSVKNSTVFPRITARHFL